MNDLFEYSGALHLSNGDMIQLLKGNIQHMQIEGWTLDPIETNQMIMLESAVRVSGEIVGDYVSRFVVRQAFPDLCDLGNRQEKCTRFIATPESKSVR